MLLPPLERHPEAKRIAIATIAVLARVARIAIAPFYMRPRRGSPARDIPVDGVTSSSLRIRVCRGYRKIVIDLPDRPESRNEPFEIEPNDEAKPKLREESANLIGKTVDAPAAARRAGIIESDLSTSTAIRRMRLGKMRISGGKRRESAPLGSGPGALSCTDCPD
jgi:hypothetical protein